MIAIARGTQLGRYLLTSHLATGGMGEVWLAREHGADEVVVIKSLLPHLAADPELVRMFVNEARVAAALSHPSIVRLIELGCSASGHYIAMEYIDGYTLRELLTRAQERGKVVPPWLVCQVVGEVCGALEYAHDATDVDGNALGFVHRDLTPDNVMVTRTGDTKLLDFGLARVAPDPATQSGILKGKFAYLAPERISADSSAPPPDRRVDIYAIGVLMYELLTGVQPFRAPSVVGLLRAIVEAESQPQAPRELAPWVSPELEAIVLRALCKAPEERFQTAGDVRQAVCGHLATSGLFPTKRHVAAQLEALFSAREVPPDDLATEPERPASEDDGARSARGAAPSAPTSASAAIAAFERGLECIARRDYDAALRELTTASALDPDNRVYRSNINRLKQRLDR